MAGIDCGFSRSMQHTRHGVNKPVEDQDPGSQGDRLVPVLMTALQG
jgi:hypothetical protein